MNGCKANYQEPLCQGIKKIGGKHNDEIDIYNLVYRICIRRKQVYIVFNIRKALRKKRI